MESVSGSLYESWIKGLVEQGPTFVAMGLFIVLVFIGKLRMEREIIEKDKIISKHEATGVENINKLLEAVKALASVAQVMNQAIHSLEESRKREDAWTGEERRRGRRQS